MSPATLAPSRSISPFYILALVLHDQSDDTTRHLAKIHDALHVRAWL